MRKNIGIVSWKTGENSFGVTIPYLEFIDFFGDPVLISPTMSVPENLDAIILPGGPDIDPSRYNQIPDYRTGRPCPFREYFDKYLLEIAIKNKIPIFGICRGFQSINVHLGGKLTQTMYHETNSITDRSKKVHELILFPNKFPQGLTKVVLAKKEVYKVNSIHHQGIKTDQLAEGLNSIAKYKGYIEAFVHNTLPIAGVQYHPEELFDDLSYNMFEYLLNFNEIKESIQNEDLSDIKLKS